MALSSKDSVGCGASTTPNSTSTSTFWIFALANACWRRLNRSSVVATEWPNASRPSWSRCWPVLLMASSMSRSEIASAAWWRLLFARGWRGRGRGGAVKDVSCADSETTTAFCEPFCEQVEPSSAESSSDSSILLTVLYHTTTSTQILYRTTKLGKLCQPLCYKVNAQIVYIKWGLSKLKSLPRFTCMLDWNEIGETFALYFSPTTCGCSGVAGNLSGGIRFSFVKRLKVRNDTVPPRALYCVYAL